MMSAVLSGGALRTAMLSMTCMYWSTSSCLLRYSALVRC
jgi:hypothetical protein